MELLVLGIFNMRISSSHTLQFNTTINIPEAATSYPITRYQRAGNRNFAANFRVGGRNTIGPDTG